VPGVASRHQDKYSHAANFFYITFDERHKRMQIELTAEVIFVKNAHSGGNFMNHDLWRFDGKNNHWSLSRESRDLQPQKEQKNTDPLTYHGNSRFLFLYT
jgi:hypothetical protein